MVVSLVDVEGKKLKAFLANILETALAGVNWNGTYLFKSLGLKSSSFYPEKSYYHFKLVKQDAEKTTWGGVWFSSYAPENVQSQ